MKTTDIALAAYLKSLGFTCVVGEQKNKRFEFCFGTDVNKATIEDEEKMYEVPLLEHFQEGKALIEPSIFYQNLQSLKAIIHHKRANDYDN